MQKKMPLEAIKKLYHHHEAMQEHRKLNPVSFQQFKRRLAAGRTNYDAIGTPSVKSNGTKKQREKMEGDKSRVTIKRQSLFEAAKKDAMARSEKVSMAKKELNEMIKSKEIGKYVDSVHINDENMLYCVTIRGMYYIFPFSEIIAMLKFIRSCPNKIPEMKVGYEYPRMTEGMLFMGEVEHPEKETSTQNIDCDVCERENIKCCCTDPEPSGGDQGDMKDAIDKKISVKIVGYDENMVKGFMDSIKKSPFDGRQLNKYADAIRDSGNEYDRNRVKNYMINILSEKVITEELFNERSKTINSILSKIDLFMALFLIIIVAALITYIAFALS